VNSCTCYIGMLVAPSRLWVPPFPEAQQSVLLTALPPAKVFVMVGCPQGLVLDSKEYYAPVITPHEAVVAFTGRDWEPARYRLDFSGLLDPSVAEAVEGQEPRLSFISGGRALLGTPGIQGPDHHEHGEGVEEEAGGVGGQLVAREQDMAVAELKASGALQVASAAEYMQYRRTYTGLQTPGTGAAPKPVEMAVHGLSGRAAVYKTEPAGQQQQQRRQ